MVLRGCEEETMTAHAELNRTATGGVDIDKDFNVSGNKIQYDGLELIEHNLKLILPPILIVIATCGNLTGFLVVEYSIRLSHISASIYMRLYFVLSTLVLFLGTGQNWICLLTDSPFLWNSSDSLCRIWEFFSSVLFYFPIWLLVAFLVDRSLQATRSCHAAMICTLFAAKVICVTILSGLITVSVHAMWTFELLPQKVCGIPAERSDFHSLVWPWITVVMFSFLPLGLLLVCSLRLLLFIRAYRHHCPPSNKNVSFNLDIEVLSPQTSVSRNADSPIELVPMVNNGGEKQCTTASSDRTKSTGRPHIVSVNSTKSDTSHKAFSKPPSVCCMGPCESREVEKLTPSEVNSATCDTRVTSPYLWDSNPSSEPLVTTAISISLICFVCTLPATVVNVYMMQVPAHPSLEKLTVDQLTSLFTVFQMLPVLSHAVIPLTGLMTSRMIREETLALFRKSGNTSPRINGRRDHSFEEIRTTPV